MNRLFDRVDVPDNDKACGDNGLPAAQRDMGRRYICRLRIANVFTLCYNSIEKRSLQGFYAITWHACEIK